MCTQACTYHATYAFTHYEEKQRVLEFMPWISLLGIIIKEIRPLSLLKTKQMWLTKMIKKT